MSAGIELAEISLILWCEILFGLLQRTPVNSGQQTVQIVMRQGYNMLHWTQSGMTYWAVSDLNSSELQELVRLVQGRNGHIP